MRWIPGGTFLMGSDDFYPEERPVHRGRVDGFWMDEHPVTVAEFRRFVQATGYVTVGRAAARPGGLPRRRPGAARARLARVPARRAGPVDLRRLPQLVGLRAGRQLAAPGGPGQRRSTAAIATRSTHVAYEDAEAYAAWAGKELPTEAEWEFAARGGLEGAIFAWGDELRPDGQDDGEHLAGRVPVAEPAARRLRGHVAGRHVPAQRLRAVRHGRQRLGVDGRLLHAAHTERAEHAVLRAAQPAGHAGRSYEPATGEPSRAG